MLSQYPKAKVIWCHIAQVRYAERATAYSPAYIEGLIKRFPAFTLILHLVMPTLSIPYRGNTMPGFGGLQWIT